jgi:hypothetical protein
VQKFFLAIEFISAREIIKYEKGIWWMPWRIKAMKDVTGCDKLWGVANKL